MDSKEILKFCMQQGVLLDKEVLNILTETPDFDSVKLMIERIKSKGQQRVITKEIFYKNKEDAERFFLSLPEENQKKLEKLKINLGLSIEITKTIEDPVKKEEVSFEKLNKTKTTKIPRNPLKKLEVDDFVKYFRGRFAEMKLFLQENSKLDNLTSIGKISNVKQKFSIIGLISNKSVTKNKNIIFEVEDMTGKINVLVSQNKQELYKKAEEVALDSVLGFNCSGSSEFLFANEIFFPDSNLGERKHSIVEEYALFISDLHFGSKKFLRENFLKFINYLNGEVPNTPEFDKIKYLIIAGDLITGVGNYPNQERDLEIKDLEEQFLGVAELLGKIRKDIEIIIIPGNHDCVRIMEPQPIFDEKYAWPLYELKNVTVLENPSQTNIGAVKGFSGFDVLVYHGFSLPYYASTIPKLISEKAMNSPEKIMIYLLQNRHLAPTHASTQYYPSENDPLVIKKIPDIFFAGHTHKSAVTYYNNILVISGSSWEGKTAYQEKFGNEPDHCKVPMLNLKTRAVKILDFE